MSIVNNALEKPSDNYSAKASDEYVCGRHERQPCFAHAAQVDQGQNHKDPQTKCERVWLQRGDC